MMLLGSPHLAKRQVKETGVRTGHQHCSDDSGQGKQSRTTKLFLGSGSRESSGLIGGEEAQVLALTLLVCPATLERSHRRTPTSCTPPREKESRRSGSLQLDATPLPPCPALHLIITTAPRSSQTSPLLATRQIRLATSIFASHRRRPTSLDTPAPPSSNLPNPRVPSDYRRVLLRAPANRLRSKRGIASPPTPPSSRNTVTVASNNDSSGSAEPPRSPTSPESPGSAAAAAAARLHRPILTSMPDTRQQSFDEIYGPPENFLEIEVRRRTPLSPNMRRRREKQALTRNPPPPLSGPQPAHARHRPRQNVHGLRDRMPHQHPRL